jgi:hypothetical protein
MMDTAKFNADILPKLNQCRNYLDKVSSNLDDTNAIVLVESQGLFEDVIYGMQRVLRKLPSNRNYHQIKG